MTIEKFRQAAESFLSKRSLDRIEKILNISDLTDSPQILFEMLSENKPAS
jgi:hypothetical protein